MSYVTRCTCDDHQLAYVGCDCENDGPERVVYTLEEIEQQQREAELAAIAEREAAEADYWERQIAEHNFSPPIEREDYHDYTLKAEAHQ